MSSEFSYKHWLRLM